MGPTRYTVYCHTHIESGRRYIGLTKKTMMQRWNQHVDKSRHPGKNAHLWNAIRKYGKDAFSHEVLGVFSTLEEANVFERDRIAFYDTRNPVRGFNLQRGGNYTPHAVTNPWDRPEYRAANLPKLLQRNTDPDVRASISAKLTGRKLSSEHVAHMSNAQKGRKESPEHVAKVAAANTGRKHSPEARANISKAQRGRKLSPEHVAKMRRPISREAVAKMLQTKAAKFIPNTVCRNGHIRDGIDKNGKVFCKLCRYASAKKRRARPEVKAADKAYKHAWYLKYGHHKKK